MRFHFNVKTILFLTVFLFFLGVSNTSSRNELDSLRKVLDLRIEGRGEYMLVKEKQIDSLVQAAYAIKDSLKLYEAYNDIYKIYATYRFDSAWVYSNKCEEIADELDDQTLIDKANLNKAMLLSITGMLYESRVYLDKVNRPTMDSTLLLPYYSCNEMFYYGMRGFGDDNAFIPEYSAREKLYVDSVFQITEDGSLMRHYYTGYNKMRAGEFGEAEKVLQSMLDTLPRNSRMYAVICSNMASLQLDQADSVSFEKYLILSSIADIESAQKENMAMQRLAVYLFECKPKELDRAYLYTQTSMEDAQFFNNRLRIVQVATTLPTIVGAYNKKSRNENENLKISIVIISVLFLLMIVALMQIYKQIKRLDRNKKELHKLNKELNYINEKLQHANKNKEEYVGMFMDLCSSYLNKMSQNRETVIRKILTKQIDELYQLNNSKNVIQSEINEFFSNFDTAFLNIYPTFLTEFNMLLEEEQQMKGRGDHLLNTELRIFALIRLGITDSSQIASFLRYAPQTIYNYRTKVKNSAKGDREKFEDKVMKIGI